MPWHLSPFGSLDRPVLDRYCDPGARADRLAVRRLRRSAVARHFRRYSSRPRSVSRNDASDVRRDQSGDHGFARDRDGTHRTRVRCADVRRGSHLPQDGVRGSGPEGISRYGMWNARLSAIQRTFQLAIIVVIGYIRWGGFYRRKTSHRHPPRYLGGPLPLIDQYSSTVAPTIGANTTVATANTVSNQRAPTRCPITIAASTIAPSA